MSEIIISMWLAAWIIQLCRIYYPIFRRVPYGHIVRKQWILCSTIVALFAILLVPFSLPAMLSEKHIIRYQNGFLKGLLGED